MSLWQLSPAKDDLRNLGKNKMLARIEEEQLSLGRMSPEQMSQLYPAKYDLVPRLKLGH